MTRTTTITRGRGLIPNPILNSPFAEPSRHLAFTSEGITDTIVEGRRASSYFIPIPQAKKGKPQLDLAGLDPEEKREIVLVNRLRERVSMWRQGGYLHVERRTKHLLEHWRREEREQKLFFCQLEAVETAIYLVEAAPVFGDKLSEKLLGEAQDAHNPLLFRLAFKMATGSGKTLVMAMLIAWQGLNKLANPDDKRFSSNFLVVTPGITIRDRLQVLLPEIPRIVGPEQVKKAAEEARKGRFDILVVCGFAFDAHAFEAATEVSPKNGSDPPPGKAGDPPPGAITVLLSRMNPDLAMGDELLKKTGAGNLFMVFGEPDITLAKTNEGKYIAEIRGLDVYDPTTGEIRSHTTDDIACWFIDTDYSGDSFFVRHAYFTGANDPYEKLKRALKAEIDETTWSTLYTTKSRPFDAPKSGLIAIKVINHYGDEVLKVYGVE